jgi:catechol 2,3-dioxygenase-like lactoylglutathione lyase family enzyme
MKRDPFKPIQLLRAASLSVLAIYWAAAGAAHAAPASADGSTQAPAAVIDFAEFAPNGFSVVVRDAKRAAVAWSDVLGIPVASIFEPQAIVYPPGFDGDRTGNGPTIALLMMANMSVTLHQPPPGRNYWRELLNAHGQTLYRLGFQVHGLAAATNWLERNGGKLVLGDPAKSPYVNVNLWPRYGFAVEMNEQAPNAAQSANPVVLKYIQPPRRAFVKPGPKTLASNLVSTIAFVVPDLDRAIRDYAALFGLPPGSAIRIDRPRGVPLETAALRLSNGVMLELNTPKPGPSLWRTRLQRHGPSMVSIGFRVESLRDQLTSLRRKGGRLILGGAGQRYAYVDFTGSLGLMIELRE